MKKQIPTTEEIIEAIEIETSIKNGLVEVKCEKLNYFAYGGSKAAATDSLISNLTEDLNSSLKFRSKAADILNNVSVN